MLEHDGAHIRLNWDSFSVECTNTFTTYTIDTVCLYLHLHIHTLLYKRTSFPLISHLRVITYLPLAV